MNLLTALTLSALPWLVFQSRLSAQESAFTVKWKKVSLAEAKPAESDDDKHKKALFDDKEYTIDTTHQVTGIAIEDVQLDKAGGAIQITIKFAANSEKEAVSFFNSHQGHMVAILADSTLIACCTVGQEIPTEEISLSASPNHPLSENAIKAVFKALMAELHRKPQ